jgi:transposase
VGIDMSPTFVKGSGEALPATRITFDKLHVLAHAHHAVDRMRRIKQRCQGHPKFPQLCQLKSSHPVKESKRVLRVERLPRRAPDRP